MTRCLGATSPGVDPHGRGPRLPFERIGPTSAIMMMTCGITTAIVTYTCLPDTMPPPS